MTQQPGSGPLGMGVTPGCGPLGMGVAPGCDPIGMGVAPGPGQAYPPRRRIKYVLIAATVGACVAVFFTCIAVGTPSWFVTGTRTVGLWKECSILTTRLHAISNTKGGCQPLTTTDSNYSLTLVVRIFAMAGLSQQIMSLLLFALALCNQSPRHCTNTAGGMLILSALCLSVCVSVFYVFNGRIVSDVAAPYVRRTTVFVSGGTGYSFGMCCFCAGVAFLSGILAHVAASQEVNPRAGAVIGGGGQVQYY